MIYNVDVKNSEDIANSFLSRNIAQVSSILFLPYLKNKKICQMAYVEIASWCDSRVAYNFMRSLKALDGEARLYNKLNKDCWVVQINTHYDAAVF